MIRENNLIDAASLLAETPDRFQLLVEKSFGREVSEEQARTGAVSYLPKLANGPVITTNFDRVLEAAFQAAGMRRVDPPPYDPESPRYEIFHDVLGKAVLDWRARYAASKRWLENRPWGVIEVISSGRKYAVTNAIISIGRSTNWWRHDVNLRAQPVSRLHLLVSKTLAAIDLRPKYGTTMNCEFLTYGNPRSLQSGDVIVLAGIARIKIHVLEYPPFDGSIASPLNPPEEDQPLEDGWGILVDGSARTCQVLSELQYFLEVDPTGG